MIVMMVSGRNRFFDTKIPAGDIAGIYRQNA